MTTVDYVPTAILAGTKVDDRDLKRYVLEALATGELIYQLDAMLAFLGITGPVTYVDFINGDDTNDGTIDYPLKWPHTAIAQHTDNDNGAVIFKVGNYNLDENDAGFGAFVQTIRNLTLIFAGGGSAKDGGETGCSFRRYHTTLGLGNATGPCLEIQEPTKMFGPSEFFTDHATLPGVRLNDTPGGGEDGSFGDISQIRMVGWGIMTVGMELKGANYNNIHDCVFEELTKGIEFTGGVGNPNYNQIHNNEFRGVTYPHYASTAPDNCDIHSNVAVNKKGRSHTNFIYTNGNTFENFSVYGNRVDILKEDFLDIPISTFTGTSNQNRVFGNTYRDKIDGHDKNGLSFRGVVSAEEGGSETTVFYVSDVFGLKDDYLNSRYYVQVLRTTDGAAPVGEMQQLTDYVSDTGKITVGSAFTADVNTGDEILILHESLAPMVSTFSLVVLADENGSVPERIQAVKDETATILAAVLAIQNNTRFTAAVPEVMNKPDAGDEAFQWLCNLYDTAGNLEDPDDNEIVIRVMKDDGTYITANLYKENALSTALDNPTDTVTFPPASGWRAMERTDVGRYFLFYKVASTETEESLTVEFGWEESSVVNVQYRKTKVADIHGDLAEIRLETDADALAQGAGSVASNVTLAELVRAITDIVRAGGTGDLAAILADTNELQTDWTNGGRLDLILDAILANVGDASGHTLTSLVAKIGDIARSLDLILGSRWDSSGDLGTDIAALVGDIGNRYVESFVEFWADEILNANDWEETLDGAGTGAIGIGNGIVYYDIDTDAVVDNDVFLNSVKRWRCNPSAFGDSEDIVQKFVVEFMVQLTGNLTDHDNSHFFLGLNPAKSNVSAGSDVAQFYLNSDALSTITTVGAGNEAYPVSGPPTLTNWNKYRIEVLQDQMDFYVNGTLKNSHTMIIPDKAVYIILGTRAENAASVGLNIGPVRAWYEEV